MAKKRRKSKQPTRKVGTRGIPLNAGLSPSEGSDAGSDEDLRAASLARRVRLYRTQALKEAADGRRLLGHSRSGADASMRRALEAAARAFWWAEDTELEQRQHELLHRLGRWTRRNLGCELSFDGKRYAQACPVAIAHKRFGNSVGYVGRHECSICGCDLSECEHIVGRSYWIRGGPLDRRACAMCLRMNCTHSPNRLYRVPVIRIVRDAQLHEISIVARPAQPEARLTELPIETAALKAALGPEFTVGMSVSCDKCLGDCWGFDGLD